MSVSRAPVRGIRFAGYASVFNRLDRGGDVVRQGAFQQSLDTHARVPLLWQHQPGKTVGIIERLKEDERGLQVIGSIHDDAFGQRLAHELVTGSLSGLSFGYRVVRARRRGRERHLERLELLEVSLVRNPMQPLARVHKVTARP